MPADCQGNVVATLGTMVTVKRPAVLDRCSWKLKACFADEGKGSGQRLPDCSDLELFCWMAALLAEGTSSLMMVISFGGSCEVTQRTDAAERPTF